MTQDETEQLEHFLALKDRLISELEPLTWSRASLDRFMEAMAAIRSEESGEVLIDLELWLLATLLIKGRPPNDEEVEALPPHDEARELFERARAFLVLHSETASPVLH